VVIFLDTSFLYALAVKGDVNHQQARELFSRALSENALLVTHNLILVESAALLQKRHGQAVAAALIKDSRHFKTVIIDEKLHQQVTELFVRSGKRRLSLVDLFSFALMKRDGIQYALAFDEDFQKQGFDLWGEKTEQEK